MYNIEPQPEFIVSDDGVQVVASGVTAFKSWRITPECLAERDTMNQYHVHVNLK